MKYHNPVLLEECIAGLNIKPNGIYVDTTFGGGGHSKLILENLNHGKLFSFDKDRAVENNILQHKSFKLIYADFRYIKNFLRIEGITKIDGLLADLGVSSNQIDEPNRGFSIRFNGNLDMRMNQSSLISATHVVNEYCEKDLSNIFFQYGELKNSKIVAKRIVESRKDKPILTTYDLVRTVSGLSHPKNKNKFLARVFQSIRIEVNDEISALKEMLNCAVDLLDLGGRIVVLSYHSLEDRLVKNLFKKGNLEGNICKDFFGNSDLKLKEINKKVIVANNQEISRNSRARSVRLRIAEKI